MSDLTFSYEFENQIRAAMAVPDPSPEFLKDLRQQLITHSEEPRDRSVGFFSRPTLKLGLAALTVVLIILLAIDPQRVASAFQQLLGYIPGLGFVDQNAPIRVLTEPVSQNRDGVTVIVNEVFLDAARTVLVFKFDGITMDSVPEGETQSAAFCSEHSIIRLPDGRELVAGAGWGTGWSSGMEYHFEFEPIPMDVDEAVFFVPCLMGTISGSAPENWELPLHFIPAPPEMTIYPVIEIPTPTAWPVSTTKTTALPDLVSSPTIDAEAFSPDLTEIQEALIPTLPAKPENAIHLTLDRAVQLEDGYILYATFSWESNLYPFVSPGMAKLLDADGKIIPIEYADPDFSGISDPQQQSLAVKALGSLPTGPITLMIEEAHAELFAEGSFSFDAGPTPQPGDVWDLNQPIEVSGYPITILSVSAIDSHGHLGFEFKVDTGPDVENARLIDPEHPPMGGGGGGGGGGSTETVRTTQLLYGDELPAGLITIAVQSIGLRLQGPWQVTWTPTEDLQGDAASSEPASCLTSETWAQAKQRTQALPAIWAGKLAHYGPVSEGEDWHISVLNLDDNSEQPIGPGTWPALSPDGSHLAYSGADGLYIVDLTTGEKKHLSRTNANDYNPLWSPDGTQIAFVRGASAFEIFLIEADGTNLRALTNGPTYESLGGWLPDGQHILYGTPNADGVLLHSLDITSKAIEDLFTIQATKDLSIAISPDGTRLAYMERLFGYKNGLFISNLDGSHRQFFGDAETEIFSEPIWSPDGKWLLLSVWDDQVNDVLPFLALIQVDSCQIIPLPELTGQFSSWVP